MRPQPSTPTVVICIFGTFACQRSGPADASGARPRSYLLNDRRDALAAANAGRREPVFPGTPPEFQGQREQQPGPGHAERMAEGNGSPIDVGLVAIEAQLLFDREV